MNKNILIIIDYQNDFVSPKGKIAKKFGNPILKNSQKISSKIQKLIDIFHNNNSQVLFLTSDYSLKKYKGALKEHKSKSAYGEIAIKNTWGHKLYQLKHLKKDKFIIKNFFDGFYKTKLDNYLKNKKIKNIYLCGVNTDVCVFHTAIGAMNRGYTVSLIEDATATISKDKKIFLNYLSKYIGVNIIKSKNI